MINDLYLGIEKWNRREICTFAAWMWVWACREWRESLQAKRKGNSMPGGNNVQTMRVWAAHVSYVPCRAKEWLTSQAERERDGSGGGSDE